MVSSEHIAQSFSALAHVSRVDLLKELLRHIPDGATTGRLGEATGLPASTLAFHLREMERGGVVRRRAEGRQTIVTLDLARLGAIASRLTALCCADNLNTPDIWAEDNAREADQ